MVEEYWVVLEGTGPSVSLRFRGISHVPEGGTLLPTMNTKINSYNLQFTGVNSLVNQKIKIWKLNMKSQISLDIPIITYELQN